MGAMDDAVENGVGQGGITDHLMPAIDRHLAGDQQGSPVIAIIDDLEQIAALLGMLATSEASASARLIRSRPSSASRRRR